MQNGAEDDNKRVEGADVVRREGEASPLSQWPALDVCGHSLTRRSVVTRSRARLQRICASKSSPMLKIWTVVPLATMWAG